MFIYWLKKFIKTSYKRHKKKEPGGSCVTAVLPCLFVQFPPFLTCLFVLTEAYRGGGAV